MQVCRKYREGCSRVSSSSHPNNVLERKSDIVTSTSLDAQSGERNR
jgi:hypothetical protein